MGQDHVVDRVAAGLAMGLRGLRGVGRTRPRATFLFAGPTGVGKTALARTVGTVLYGPAGGLIRIDMSELSERWGTSRLVGPPPGYLGHDQRDSWLTTRIRARPASVVLLDEFEKASPQVWSLFLQVLEDGRLTDGAGRTASFSQSVIILTSNLGSGETTRTPLGFAATNQQSDRRRGQACLSAVRRALPPELFNRLDACLAFDALSDDVLLDIARKRLDEAVRQVKGAGYSLRIAEGVAELVASHNADPSLGARPLIRAIDELIREPLTDLPPGSYAVEPGTHPKLIFNVL